MHNGVLLDTSFFLRLLNDDDPLYENAEGYFRYFLQNEVAMAISTISIAEYCVGGALNELPLRNLQVIPFNIDHAKRTGDFARIVFQNKQKLKLTERNLIPNDSKLFAQADTEKTIGFYLSSDSESVKIYNLLRAQANPMFQFLDLKVPYNEAFGVLQL